MSTDWLLQDSDEGFRYAAAAALAAMPSGALAGADVKMAGSVPSSPSGGADVSRDGFDDVLIGSPVWSSGAAHLLFGQQ
jgi:hypothetical protein